MSINEQVPPNDSGTETHRLAAKIVASYVRHNLLPADELPSLTATVYKALKSVGAPEPALPNNRSAVAVDKSITPDHLICLEDGKKLKSLKLHLRTHHGLSPEGYRAKWDLPKQYPMVAPTYAQNRSVIAKAGGFGGKSAAVSKRGQ